MEVDSYNGWEDKFTWLVHLHVSNEQALMQEIMALVAREPDDRAAGRLIEMWVKIALFNWLTGAAGRASLYDGFMRLLAWDLAGTALAYADGDGLVALLTGRVRASENLFTLTLYHFIVSNAGLQVVMQEMLRMVLDAYVCADVMKDWFREQVDALFDGVEVVPQQIVIVALVAELLQNTYTLIAWEHVARAFRPGY
jgi:intracellular sulfur oxidation DsrE/DsrF family protein